MLNDFGIVWNHKVTKEDLELMRGFVVTSENVLDQDTHTESDQEYFNSFKEERNNRRMLEVLMTPERRWSYGMSGPYDYPVRNNKASVPLEFLDPGIALLVKVLPGS